MTKAKMKQLRENNEDPLDHKRPGGGLTGVWRIDDACSMVYYRCITTQSDCITRALPPWKHQCNTATLPLLYRSIIKALSMLYR